jgi:hypothetical protein
MAHVFATRARSSNQSCDKIINQHSFQKKMNKSLNYKVSSAWRLLYQDAYTPYTFSSETDRFAKTRCQLCVNNDMTTGIRASIHGIIHCNKDLPRHNLLGWLLDVMPCSQCDCTTTSPSQVCAQILESFHFEGNCRFGKICSVHFFESRLEVLPCCNFQSHNNYKVHATEHTRRQTTEHSPHLSKLDMPEQGQQQQGARHVGDTIC